MRISTVEQMRELDRGAVERYSIPDIMLMENAGDAVYGVIRERYGVTGRRFTLVCGSGNNGGDGFVVARKLHSSGADVLIVLFGDPAKFGDSAGKNYEICRKLNLPIDASRDPERIVRYFRDSDLIVDALFGTGLTRNVEGPHAALIGEINDSGKPVVSVDIPSGISGDTGRIMGTAVRAEATVTFGLPKIGNVMYPGWDRGGALYVSHISFPPEHYNGGDLRCSVNTPLPLPERDREGHKGSFGDALFVAGASAYYGAPLLCSRSFLRCGGGYSRLAAPQSVIRAIAAANPEVVYIPILEGADGTAGPESFRAIAEQIEKCDLFAVGPGISLSEGSQALVRTLAAEGEKPCIIDGDGITAVAEEKASVRRRKAPTIVTPHVGEMSRLTGVPVEGILEDRFSVLRNTAEDLNAVVVLKGARSLIGTPDGRVFVNMTGNPGMATAGSGDVLTGAIAACLGLGLDAESAARTGVYIHGLAGDLAAEERGEDGIVASDIMNKLPEAVRLLREGRRIFPDIRVR